ncbi:restriction endonuclease subunit S [Vibrio furnissii]|uniref:restriction endonuclease subunit S n=1 Tax=Vibrio furnissii TaxID=29494 RepID=UPI001302D5A2|nr:restriction endonuclease subunit S [Vibrio furnissii]MCG6215627.1 restriction endonuclease subunit S [Vibrio furnissii]HCG5280071.1 restriction endonuclease subunit S [Vibrio parahaemolyticus]HCG5281969.1 restriction endonuclease subunit S [Vibrio parahaemolyticus]HCG6410407.1 restriction endonuclease subunit S [Vibrio parahaemolyticus]
MNPLSKSKISDIATSYAGGTPKRTVAGYYNGTIPWVKSGEINSVNIFSSEEKITDEGLRNSSAKLVEPGAILVAMYGATAGKVGRLHIEATTNQAVLSVRSKNSNVISNDYLFWLLTFASEELIKQCQGAAQPNLSKQLIDGYQILYPSITEQQKIAEVLSTADKKIDLIDQKIAETEKLKTGLMQKLFSEGVGVQDENGNWQPHTEFQDSPFGKIPQPWSTLELAEIADIEDGDRGKSYPKQADFSDFGYCLFLSAKNVTKQGFTYETTQFISQEKHNKLRKGQVLQNDIVLTTRGTVGNFGLFKHEELFDAVRINSGMAIIRCIDSSMPNYLYQFMQSPQFKAQISKVVFGSAQPQLTIKQIKKFKVLVPISEEKKWIEETLKLANDKLTLLEQQKAETQQLKKGLMQKLLTGELRVPVEETEAA